MPRRAQAVRLFTDLVGPMAEALAINMERARSPDELRTLVQTAQRIIGNARGGQAAADYGTRFLGSRAALRPQACACRGLLLRQAVDHQVDVGVCVLPDADAHRQVLQRRREPASAISSRPGRSSRRGLHVEGRHLAERRGQRLLAPPPRRSSGRRCAAAPAASRCAGPAAAAAGWVVNSQVSCTNWLAVSCTPARRRAACRWPAARGRRRRRCCAARLAEQRRASPRRSGAAPGRRG